MFVGDWQMTKWHRYRDQSLCWCWQLCVRCVLLRMIAPQSDHAHELYFIHSSGHSVFVRLGISLRGSGIKVKLFRPWVLDLGFSVRLGFTLVEVVYGLGFWWRFLTVLYCAPCCIALLMRSSLSVSVSLRCRYCFWSPSWCRFGVIRRRATLSFTAVRPFFLWIPPLPSFVVDMGGAGPANAYICVPFCRSSSINTDLGFRFVRTSLRAFFVPSFLVTFFLWICSTWYSLPSTYPFALGSSHPHYTSTATRGPRAIVRRAVLLIFILTIIQACGLIFTRSFVRLK